MHIDTLGTLLELLFIVVISGIIARRLSIPYPIVMVLAGLGVGLVPGVPDVALHPDIVFHVFLPLLVYHAAWRSSWRALKRDFASVVMLAVVLVLLTVFVVAGVAPMLFPILTLPMAFILGAVVAPTDELAATEIGRRMKLRKRVVDILEEESLLNDATGLLLFQIGVAMLLGIACRLSRRTSPG